jgi:mono/diheme cytochrome c family protein
VASLAAAVETIGSGRNNMPAFAATLTAEQIRDVSAYVVERLTGPKSAGR